MKKYLVYLIIFISLKCNAQKNLNENLVFRKLIERNIMYPKKARYRSLYGRVYAKFIIDKMGKIDSVKIIYPIIPPKYENRTGFVEEITKGFKKLPLLGFGYDGKYILPVAFVFKNYNDSPVVAYPKNSLPSYYELNEIVLLDEIQVFGDSEPYPLNTGVRNAPPSKQIIDE
jgi:Gram-negative bacterial TonB protein C-terminal